MGKGTSFLECVEKGLVSLVRGHNEIHRIRHPGDKLPFSPDHFNEFTSLQVASSITKFTILNGKPLYITSIIDKKTDVDEVNSGLITGSRFKRNR